MPVLLLIATVIALIRFTRGAGRLAEMQMNFVSGISHELRTPLSVICSAGFNLRTKFARDPGQVENAVKHGRKEHASIRIIADRSALQGKPAIRLGIQDNGPGIPKEERARVFEPFFPGKFAIENQVHGTGLGLNLAKRIIEAHGGISLLQSELGGGTEFIATIPAACKNDTSE